jgi:hypothetical protein
MKGKAVEVINYEIDDDGENVNGGSALPSDIEDEEQAN